VIGEPILNDDGPHTNIVQKFPLFDTNGKIYAICGLVTDITERKRADAKIRAERDRAQLYLDIAEVILLALAPETEHRHCGMVT
jgi:two-component system, sensor histidine kinase and response regulator